MFKTSRMKKIRVIFHQKVHDEVIAKLHEVGVVQLKEISEVELARKAHDKEIFELSSLLAKFKEIEEFVGPPAGKLVKVKELNLEQTLKLAKRTLEKLEPRIRQLKEKVEQLDREKQELLTQLETLKNFAEIRAPLKLLQSTKEIRVIVARVGEEKVPGLFTSAKEVLNGRVFTSAVGAGKTRIVIMAYRAQDHGKLSPLLYRYEVEPLELPPFVGPPSAAIKELNKRLAKNEKQREKLKKMVEKIARKKSIEISSVRELLEIQRERLECTKLFGYTNATTLLEGWVETKQTTEVEKVLNKATGGHYVLRFYDPQPSEVDSVPIKLDNPKVVKDFELVTEMYGLPRYDEVDPTPFLSFTFALFFGIALSDAGYGLLMGIFMASGIWLAKIFPKSLRRIMIVCAVFTIISGILIGGWFGFGSGIWVNPIQQPVPLLKLVIFLGIFHLLMAFGLAGALKDIFRKDWKSLVLNRLSPILIIIGFFALCFSILGIGLHEFRVNYTFPKMGIFSAFNPFEPADVVVTISRALFYTGLAIGMVGAFITSKDARGKIGRPINILYSVTGYIADVSSYTRLMALGIATGVIAFSINLILGLIYNGLRPAEITPLSAIYFGLLLIGLAFVFIAAHSFNLFISSLGCFIHTMRLHFSEFFGKFYESGGTSFTPFKAKRRFTKVERR